MEARELSGRESKGPEKLSGADRDPRTETAIRTEERKMAVGPQYAPHLAEHSRVVTNVFESFVHEHAEGIVGHRQAVCVPNDEFKMRIAPGTHTCTLDSLRFDITTDDPPRAQAQQADGVSTVTAAEIEPIAPNEEVRS